MTNWFILHWTVYDQEVSFKDYGTEEKEKNLPYKLAHLYKSTREKIEKPRFMKLIVLSNIYSIAAGIFIWLVWDRCEAEYNVNPDGKTLGLYTYGVYMTMAVVFTHHI